MDNSSAGRSGDKTAVGRTSIRVQGQSLTNLVIDLPTQAPPPDRLNGESGQLQLILHRGRTVWLDVACSWAIGDREIKSAKKQRPMAVMQI